MEEKINEKKKFEFDHSSLISLLKSSSSNASTMLMNRGGHIKLCLLDFL